MEESNRISKIAKGPCGKKPHFAATTVIDVASKLSPLEQDSDRLSILEHTESIPIEETKSIPNLTPTESPRKSILKRSDSIHSDETKPIDCPSHPSWIDQTPTPKSIPNPHHINSSLEEWALMTGWHGVVDFFYAKTLWLKLIWAGVIVMGGFLAINESASMILDFTRGDKWMTSISYQDPDDGGAVPWPNLTVSNLNWLGETSLNEYRIDNLALVAYVISGDPESIVFYYRTQQPDKDWNKTELQHLVNETIDQYNTYLASKQNNDTNRQSIIQGLAQSCKQTVLHCGHSNNFDLRIPRNCCDGSIINPKEMSSFNLDIENILGPRTTFDKAGYDGGLYFLLDPKAEDDYTIVRKAEIPAIGFNLRLYYGDQPDSNSASLMISTSKHVVISITAENYRVASQRASMIPWYAKAVCQRDFQYDYINTSGYTIAFCQEECKARYLIDKFNCSCQVIQLKSSNATCEGNQVAQFNCSTVLKQLESENITLLPLSSNKINVSECLNSCIEPCDYKVVSTKISRATFPTRGKVKSFTTYVNNALDPAKRSYTESGVSSFALIEIYFELNQWVVMEKMQRISVDDLISNIGGSLGVWTGISIISIIQALVYVFYGLQSIVDSIVERCTREEAVFVPQTHRRENKDST